MSEYDSPNYAEFSYTRKSEGAYKKKRMLLVFGYILFALAYFGVCVMTKLIPIFLNHVLSDLIWCSTLIS